MTSTTELGPLARMAGTWEGDEGVDVAFSNHDACLSETPYRERASFSPFGPVENGAQVLHGLDYRTSAWRHGEEIPFHTEVGYWLWDAADGQVMRCFIVPRGCTILAGGPAGPDDSVFTMSAEVGSEAYGILSNRFLAANARSIAYTVTVTIGDDGSYSYEETTTLEHRRSPELVIHTDRNRLRRLE